MKYKIATISISILAIAAVISCVAFRQSDALKQNSIVLIESFGWEIDNDSDVKHLNQSFVNFYATRRKPNKSTGHPFNIDGDVVDLDAIYINAETNNTALSNIEPYMFKLKDEMPYDTHLVCEIAYYENKLCMAFIYPESTNDSGTNGYADLIWPINTRKAVVKDSIVQMRGKQESD